MRPIAKEDIHLTLVPPWKETLISTAVEKLRLAIEPHGPFALEFRHIGYGPDTRRPRFLWAECFATKELTDLHAALLRAFGQTDERPFLPHVTLARIRANAAMISRKCPINRDLACAQQIETVELMQSPPPGERGYKVIASLPLKNRPIS
jgi:2'-5' RNA ligase